MASLFNLKRNSRVFFTTNLTTAGAVASTGFTAANTQELTVLDGFTFSQGVAATAITVTEAGNVPNRGQRSFNTTLNPVDFSFGTYIRPKLNSTVINADESVLWNALWGTADASSAANTTFTYTTLTSAAATTAGLITLVGTGLVTVPIASTTNSGMYIFKGMTGAYASVFNSGAQVISSSATTMTLQMSYPPSTAAAAAFTTATVGASGALTLSVSSWNSNVAVASDTLIGNTAYAEVSTVRSNANQLLQFGLIIVLDSVAYTIDAGVLDQAALDFALANIATVTWTGKGQNLNTLQGTAFPTLTNAGTTSSPTVVFSGGLTGTATGKNTTAPYITNKLSTLALTGGIGGTGTAYNLALTGGTMTIANNVTYVVPANLGVLNRPVGYYTGTRGITGSVNAYLKTGTNMGSQLLQDIIASSVGGATEQKFQLGVTIGGATNNVKAEVFSYGCSLQVPTVDATQDIISTVIAFTSQGSSVDPTLGANFDVGATNDLRVRYFSNQ